MTAVREFAVSVAKDVLRFVLRQAIVIGAVYLAGRYVVRRVTRPWTNMRARPANGRRPRRAA